MVEITIFRVVQEVVNNIVQHSKAKHADFVFEFFNECIEAGITDDGVGFDVASLKGESESNRGLGLLGMAERMSTIGGEFILRSTPGKGTAIRLIVKREGPDNGEDSNPGGG
jgi:signal transduction histidine kinase